VLEVYSERLFSSRFSH